MLLGKLLPENKTVQRAVQAAHSHEGSQWRETEQVHGKQGANFIRIVKT